jgi:hypothetical protein
MMSAVASTGKVAATTANATTPQQRQHELSGIMRANLRRNNNELDRKRLEQETTQDVPATANAGKAAAVKIFKHSWATHVIRLKNAKRNTPKKTELRSWCRFAGARRSPRPHGLQHGGDPQLLCAEKFNLIAHTRHIKSHICDTIPKLCEHPDILRNRN